MTFTQAVGYQLLNTSAVTAIVGQRVFHGRRPEEATSGQSSFLPSIAYEEVSGTLILANGWIETRSVLIHNYAPEAKDALALSKQTKNVFHRLRESVNGFDIQRAYVRGSGGLIYDSAVRTFDVPIEVDLYFYEDEA